MTSHPLSSERLPSYDPWIEVSLDNLVHNLNQVRRRMPHGAGVLAVVKDCAYGCGATAIARALEQNGVDFFAVARPIEARALRQGRVRSPILVFGEAASEDLRWGWRNDIHFALNGLSSLQRWEAAAVSVRFHCKIDTGMGRMGILPDEIPTLQARLSRRPRLHCTGIFTHFAGADLPNPRIAIKQLSLFGRCLDGLRAQGINPPYIHCANSAAALRFGDRVFTLVRPGIALYGCAPDPAQTFDADLRPVITLKGSVVKVKRVLAGTPISYGGTYHTRETTHIATVAIGYGQGLPRSLSNRGEVLIRGRRYRIAGKVTMDYIMVDIGPKTPISVGDEVVAMGRQGKECITVDEVAVRCGTIGYEILCGLPSSIDRLFTYKNKLFDRAPARMF